jgi:TRAP-type C4-dicarboxylate transport system permease small subunit
VDAFLKIEEKILQLEKFLMFFAMITMVLAVGMQVFFRYVIPMSVPWTEELSIISFIFIVFFGAARAGRYDKHLGIKNIVDAFQPSVYIKLWYLKKIVLISFLLVVMVLEAVPMVLQGWSNTFTIIKIPMFFVLVQIPIFGVLMIFHTLMSMVRKDYQIDLVSRKKGK